MLVTSPNFKKIDQNRLYRVYEKWPQHFKDATKLSGKLDHGHDFYQSVIFCGMGGSATSCDILNEIMQYFGSIPSFVIRGEDIRCPLDSHSLVIVNSVSGDTEETLSMMKKASRKKAEVIAISSGGRLHDFAISNGHQHIQIPNISIPRASLPYLIMPGLNLINVLFQKSLNKEISLIYNNLSKVATKISVGVPEDYNAAKKIAAFLKNGFAFCFTSPSLVSVGSRFKNSLNENAKVHCTKESILEASHNEIVPFTFTHIANTRKVLFLQWIGDSGFVTERFKKISSFFSEIGQPWMEMIASDKSLLAAILSSIYILDYATIYMAISRNIDPSRTPAIDILKKI